MKNCIKPYTKYETSLISATNTWKQEKNVIKIYYKMKNIPIGLLCYIMATQAKIGNINSCMTNG